MVEVLQDDRGCLHKLHDVCDNALNITQFLQCEACGRSDVCQSWTDGHCPLCGALVEDLAPSATSSTSRILLRYR
jgi:hypothetical protein